MNRICADIKCPYFTSETDRSLSCEGCEMGVKNTMRFENIEAKLDYIERFCFNYPNECHICIAAERKYN